MSWSVVKLRLGKLLNIVGCPGVVRECDYKSIELHAVVKVRKLGLYTRISVNGTDLYFNRFTGTLDGVGNSPTTDCTHSHETECTHFEPDAELVCLPPPIHSRNR